MTGIMDNSAAMSAHKSGSKPPLDSFRHMKERDLAAWASVLCHQPPPTTSQSNTAWWSSYKSFTKDQISTLPDHLRAYPSHFQRLMNKSQRVKSRAEARELCPLHDKLNRILARSTLGWIKAEIDVNIPAVLLPLLNSDLIDADVQLYFEPLQDVTGMWTAPQKFSEAWMKPVKPKWSYQQDHCAGCVLARFASDVSIVAAFKAGLIARRLDEFRRGKPSRRFSYVNYLISHFPNSEGANTKAEQIGKQIQRAVEQYKENKRNADQVDVGFSPIAEPRFSMVLPSPEIKQVKVKPAPLQVMSTTLQVPQAATYVIYSPSIYSPMPLRPFAGEVMGDRDVVSQFIEQYRRTVWEPKLGNEDYAGFVAEDPKERKAIEEGSNWNDLDKFELTANAEPAIRTNEVTVPVNTNRTMIYSPARENPYCRDARNANGMGMRDTQYTQFF